jgi:cyclic pyranopterin phosphate synthase
LAGIPGLADRALTTNGYLLERDAAALVEAGIHRVNVSIDSLERDRFFQITRRDALPRVMSGLRAIGRYPEIRPVKVNTVAMRGFTEEEALRFAELARSTDFQVRFIEFMPLDGDRAWTPEAVLSGEEIRRMIHRTHPLEERPREPSATARVFASPTARVRSDSSTPSPSPSAPIATGFASPPTASSGPACSQCMRRTSGPRCGWEPPMTSSGESSATPCGARS